MKKRFICILLTVSTIVSMMSCLTSFSTITAGALTTSDIPSDVKPLIFNANFYLRKNPTLETTVGTNATKLYNHFLNYGIAEGRIASPYFDVNWYMTQNDQGLIDHCKGNTVTAMKHFLQYVKNSGEMSNTPKKLSPIFDAGYYSQKYHDMSYSGFKTEYEFLNHFVNNGVYEGRQGSAEFDPLSYALYNDDLYSIYSSAPVNYYSHYMLHGRYEEDNICRTLCAVKSNLGDDFYATVTDKNSGKNLELIYNVESSKYPDKNSVVIQTPSKSNAQLWHFMLQADGTYKIVNAEYNKVLDVCNFGRTNTDIGAYNDNETTSSDISSQRWTLYEKDGYCYLRANCSDYVADVQYELTDDGSTVTCGAFHKGDNQMFLINIQEEEEDPYVEPVQMITNEDKLNAFSGNKIWTDTSSDPAGNTSLLPLVKMYKKSSSQYYFYLPETANLSSIPLCFSGYSSVKIGQYDIQNGYAYSFTNGKSYSMYLNHTFAGRVTFYKSTSPAMYLSTKEDLPTVTHATNADGVSISNKDNFSTKGTIATSEEGKNYIETPLKKLKGRGNASWSFSYNNFGKYSYNITLESKTKLYSTMGKGKKFCLLANNGDEAYMRNLFTFLLGQDINSEFTSKFQYVDLYDNGEYMGSFLLTDKVEINSQSVDLSCSLDDLNELANPNVDLSTCTRMSTTNNLNDNSTKGYKKWVDIAEVTTYEDGSAFDASNGDGTYLLEFEMYDRFPNEISGFISNKGQQVVVKTPEFASKDQVDFISNLFNKAEAVVYNDNSTFDDINKVIDVDSFIKIYLIQELSKNIDSCQTSYYIYYDSKIDSRLHAAPLWDYDMAYGQYKTPRLIAPNVYGESAVTSDWHSKIKGILGKESTLNFQAKVINNEQVWNRVRTLWNGENGFYAKAKEILTGTGTGTISYYINDIRTTARMNESRWGFIEKDLIASAGLNDTGETYEETTDFFVSWTLERLNWMNNGSTNTTPLISGDINGDGEVNIKDATELQLLLISDEYDGRNKYMYDVNFDGKVDIFDATYIQFYIAGIFNYL